MLVLQSPSIPPGPARDRDRCRGPATSTQAAGLAPGELPSLQQQRERMPAEFREHLFGNPLTVRVELDGQYLGDAEVLLHEDNRVQVIGFGDSHESRLAQTERARWASNSLNRWRWAYAGISAGAWQRCTTVCPTRC